MFNGVFTSLLSAYSDSRALHYANSICKECPSLFNSAICASSIRIYSELWVLRYTRNRLNFSFEVKVEIMEENLALIKWKLAREEKVDRDSFKNARYRNRIHRSYWDKYRRWLHRKRHWQGQDRACRAQRLRMEGEGLFSGFLLQRGEHPFREELQILDEVA